MPERDDMKLAAGSRIAVIGGGPAGTLFSYFLLDMAARADLPIQVDIFEPRRFNEFGPAGCNMCGGIISESLVQLLAAEGINLPGTIVQRGIDSYILHTDLGRISIDPPGQEKRIAAIHRGAGPRGLKESHWGSFDAYLLDLAASKGASLLPERVEEIRWEAGKPVIATRSGKVTDPYDLLTVAVGINSPLLKSFASLPGGFKPPIGTKTFITECFLGQEAVELYLGDAMHVFLLDIPRLEFAAIIPKGEFATVCLLGENIDKELIQAFFSAPEVKECFPPGTPLASGQCQCAPAINVTGAHTPFADRIAFIGDAGVNRLYKDGIGGSYRTAKAAARAAIFNGVSAADFAAGYGPTCRALTFDNNIGRIIFTVTRIIQKVRIARRAVLGMTFNEQNNANIPQRMSGVLWDTFTGSAPYRDVFLRTLHPGFLVRLVYEALAGAVPRPGENNDGFRRSVMRKNELGRIYPAGEPIFRQGETGDCMYVIQSGTVEVVRQSGSGEVRLAEFGEGEIFGEMALFGNNIRSATVRPLTDLRAITIDKKMFMQKIHDDPALAFRIIQKMSQRIRNLNEEIAKLVGQQPVS
ncbi:MAG TPA: cyclic nucleotide-binding domain-containing protein [Geobacteraceae bacterium]